MPRIYKLSRAGLRLLYKIRHYKGHGIHSPFVFKLITQVIEDKKRYQAYTDIATYLHRFPELKFKLRKENRLYYRLVNHFQPKTILEIGSGKGIDTLFITAPANGINCRCYERDANKYTIARKLYEDWDKNIQLHTDSLPDIDGYVDCISIDLKHINNIPADLPRYIARVSHEKSFVIVKNIRTNNTTKVLWKSIADIESRTAMLDLFNLGIIFFDKQLYRWNYQISF